MRRGAASIRRGSLEEAVNIVHNTDAAPMSANDAQTAMVEAVIGDLKAALQDVSERPATRRLVAAI